MSDEVPDWCRDQVPGSGPGSGPDTLKKLLAAARAGIAVIATIAAVSMTAAQAPYDVKANYVKREVSIPMRDGVKLFTIIYSPRATTERYPMLMTRTAYGIGPVRAGRATAPCSDRTTSSQKRATSSSTRTRAGKFKSEGEFIHHVPIVKGSPKPNESTDTWDTIDWLVKNVPNNNGRVGQWGISWAGWEVSQGMIDAHPALKASSPQAPPQDQFFGDDYHSGGAYQMMYGFNWMSTNARARIAPSERDTERFDYGTPDGYRFFLEMGSAANALKYFADDVPTYTDHMAHGTYDEYWQARNVPKDLVNINHPVLIVAGVVRRAGFLRSVPDVSRAEREESVEQDDARRWTVVARRVGPERRRHAGPDLRSGRRPRRYYRANIELPFFNYYLKDKGPPRHLRGEGRGRVRDRRQQVARRYPQWPPAGARAAQPVSAGRTGSCAFAAPADRSDDGVRRLRQRSREAGAVHRRDHDDRGTCLHGRGSAVRVRAGRTSSSTRRAPLTDDLTIAGPIDVSLQRVNDWNRRRLDREGHRRLSGDRQPGRPATSDGALPDAARRRHPAREIPQQHEPRRRRWFRVSRRS